MSPEFRKGLLFVLLGASILFLLSVASGGRELTVYFLDVGQGDAAYIEFPCGGNMLIDGGEIRQGNTDIPRFLRGKNVRRIDAVVLSHAHSDHAGGLLEVLEEFRAGILIEPGYPHTTEVYLSLLELAEEKDIPYAAVSRGDSLHGYGDAEISCLNPSQVFHENESPVNNNSVVMSLEYGDISFLFTGDIEKDAENELVSIYGDSLESDVLKVPHHGSGGSSTSGFLESVKPVVAVISAGAGNPFGHPHDRVVESYRSLGTEVYRTDTGGAVIVSTDGENLRVRRGN